MTEIIYLLVTTHITIMAVTLYLHRSQAHRSVEFHPVIAHFFRFWLWLTTGMVTREWVAVHRRHHQASDTDRDPHSPKIHGIWRVLFGGAFLYVKAKQDRDMVTALSRGCPTDWVELHLYSARPTLGIGLLFVFNTLMFGPWGIVIWLIQMIWIPFWAAGVINGLAHWWGYRNYAVQDTSRNLLPIGIWIGGEELHNNHHGDGASARFSRRWYELDIGWVYIQLLKNLGLAQVRG
jgi:stearoyl-CoA desaturase (Delta-9 desaturase)